MRIKEIPFLAVFSIILFTANLSMAGESVKLLLKSGEKTLNIQSPEQQLFSANNGNSSYKIVTFIEIPSPGEKEEIAASGIRLYHYLPSLSYYAWVPKGLELSELKKFNLHSINEIEYDMKFHPMAAGVLPEWALENNEANLILSYFDDRTTSALELDLSKIDCELVYNNTYNNRVFVKIQKDKINEIISLNYIYYIEPVDPPSYPENYGGRQQHRSNMLAQDFYSGTHYDGSGISIGMHDDGIIGPHIDYHGRLPIQFPTSNSGAHGDHVAGTIMGSGNLDPNARGMAFGADLYVYGSSNNNYDSAVSHYNKYDVVIVSKSYSNGCNAGYTSLSQQLDQQINLNSSLVHVFSAGNNGTSNCSYGAGAGWGNITGGHKMGKNVVTTGSVNSSDVLAGSSSRGPASDGRIKPDICAKGVSVYSALDENDYRTISGTSMACPGISGSFGQLYHAYKDLNSFQNPPSGLIKGIVLNTADDLGNPGPDYKHGWGRINSHRALKILEQNQYITDQISTLTKTHNISVPANVDQLRVMVYWHDYQASTSAARAIVNNLDMKITDPSSGITLPWVLNPAPNATTLNANAVRAVDSLNNMEQVTIDSPSQGSYTVTIDPTSIPQGPQTYFVVYEFVYNEITLTYPNGGEGLVPFQSERIRWDASGNTGSFTLEYSTNNGSSWTTISSSVSGSLRYYSWSVPNITTDQFKVRISRGIITDESDEKINIIRVPQNLQVDWVCPDSAKLSWNSVTQAMSYRTYKLGTKYMDSASTTNNTSYVFHGVKLNEENWLSVSANPSANTTGKRAWAIEVPGKTIGCPLEDDAAISQVITPDAGTYFDCNPPEISAWVINEGITVLQSVPVSCIIDGSTTVNGSTSGSINPGDSTYVQLSSPTGYSNGLHSISCSVNYSGDPNPYNDSTEAHQFEYRSGIVVNAPWSEDFENMGICGTFNNCGGTTCNLINGWVNDANFTLDDNDWRVRAGTTATTNTGPSLDHKPGTALGKYVYTEASGGCTFQVAQMLSPCMDMSERVEPWFSYWYHLYGSTMGELHMDVLNNGKWTYDVNGQLFGDRGNVWREDVIDLKDFVGDTINIRFRGITGSSFWSDMALDDMSFYDVRPEGIDENEPIGFKIQPNPAKGEIFIQWSLIADKITSINIVDVTGKSVAFKALEATPSGSEKIDISRLHPGVYIIVIKGNKQVHSERLIVL